MDAAQHLFHIIFKQKNFLEWNGRIWIPVFTAVVFAVSYLLCKLYIWIWDRLDKDRRITNYLVKIVRLKVD